MSEDFDLPTIESADPTQPGNLELGAFSMSLAVADLDRSREFYEQLGFVVTGGDAESNYLIMKNGDAIIGLFHGMFDGNILTFNPGLTNRMERIEHFTDVRAIQSTLDDSNIVIDDRVDPDSASGPASITLVDPDGNAILIDQFF